MRLPRMGRAWDRITIYLPVILMGMLAMGTYWLARNTPVFAPASAEPAAKHEPDYFLRNFSVKSFDANGRLKSEIHGTEARHYPDTDTLEVDQPRIRSFNLQGALVLATAQRGVSNADGSQVQLFGNAVVTREAATGAKAAEPRLEIRSEFLHAFMDQEQVKTHKPVTITRGADVFRADGMTYDNQQRVLELTGRVQGTLQARAAPAP